MKFTNAERKRIREWLNKEPRAEYKTKTIDFVKDDGVSVSLTRDTHYFGDKWKVRLGYVTETLFPVAMSAPIPFHFDHKKQQVKQGNKPAWVMVPKFASVPESEPALAWDWDDKPAEDYPSWIQDEPY